MRDRLIETKGNGAYLVLYVGDREPVSTRFLHACSHFGIPFRSRRIETGYEWAAEFEGCSGVLLADSGCIMALGSRGRDDLETALDDGIGLISYDTDFASMDSQALRMLGVETIGDVVDTDRVASPRVSHPITSERLPTDVVVLDKPLGVPRVGSRYPVLLESDSGVPLCLVRDDRKVVTFCVPGDIWSLDVCGHCGMLDDVFYRSFVWAAKKPFVTFRLPPFVSAIVDDCSGSYNHFSYVDIMNRFGWKPHLALFFAGVDEVAHSDIGLSGRKIKRLYDDGLAEFGPHAISYNRLFGFDHLGRSPLSEDQLKENFELHDRKIGEWEIAPSRLAHMHFGEAGANCLPYLEDRGYEFFTRLLPLDASWFDVPGVYEPLAPQWPYGHAGYTLSVMPENPHFFQPLAVASNKTRESTDVPINSDYLWNRTYFWGESDRVDIEGAAETAVLQVRQAVSSGFYGMVATHEQRVSIMHPEQWERLWSLVSDRLSSFDLRYCLLEEAMTAARDLFHTAVTELDRRGGAIECELTGIARSSVELQVYSREGDRALGSEPVTVSNFETSRRITL